MGLGLVLAGGGARGAYEAGVLRFVFGDLPRRAGVRVGPDVVCGTSVGALNGTWIAAHTGNPVGPDTLSALWRDLRIERIWKFDLPELARAPFLFVRRTGGGPGGLIDAAPLHRLVREHFPWAALRETVAAGLLSALVVSATEIATGRCIQFVQRTSADPILLTPYFEVARKIASIGPEHVLASAAIPFLFPPVLIDGQPMVDGSLRQNTPISPALRLGVDRVLVLGVKRPYADQLADVPHVEPADLTLAFLAGKVFNALMLDPVERNLSRVERFNELFDAGESVWGPDFLDRLNDRMRPRRGATYRKVQTLFLRPTEDLGRVAAHVWAAERIPVGRTARRMLDAISGEEEADLLSYLLFDRAYTAAIERLGYEDAARREEEVARFLGIGT